MTSTDDSDHGGPRSPSPFDGSRAGFVPQFEPPISERIYNDSAHARPLRTGASARATGHSTSREGLDARRNAVLRSIQAEADAAVAELEERQGLSRIQRHQSRMSSRPAAFDANYLEREEAEEKEEDIEDLCDILLEEYGVEVEPLPPGARAPIYGPRVRAARPVTEEGVGHERERRSRMSRESRHELESSENEASEEEDEEEDEELVKSMSRGPADRLRAQTSLPGTYHGYERPFGRDWRRRHNRYDDDGYDAPSRMRPTPRGPGPAPPAGSEAFPTGEDRTRERKRDLEREREMMRERDMMGERETRRERELRMEEDMRREELEREMARRRKAQKEEWEDTDRRRRTFVAEPPYEHTHRPHSEYDLRRAESYSGPPAAANPAYEAGSGSGVETRRRRRSEYPSPTPRPRSRPPSRGQDVYMHGGRHADDAPAPQLRVVERARMRGGG